jgi:hypothetical protein
MEQRTQRVSHGLLMDRLQPELSGRPGELPGPGRKENRLEFYLDSFIELECAAL